MRFFFMGPRIFGIRPGISFSANDLLRLATGPKQNKPREQLTGSFLYVIRGEHNMVKVGVTTNPSARLASLRTGSAFPIDFSYIAVTPSTGFDIEAAAHKLIEKHRCTGEGFDVPPEMAVAAIAGAAHKLGQPILPVTAEVADQILQIAANGSGPSSNNKYLFRRATLALTIASSNHRRGGMWRHHLCRHCLHVLHRNITMTPA
jgi:hypothetical protein